MKDSDAHPFLIYLLHFEPQVGRLGHYVGITRADRLLQRMREHASLRGAAVTSHALRKGAIISVVRTWPVSDYSAERLFKERGHFARYCPRCTGEPIAAELQAIPAMVCPPQATQRHKQLSWT